MGAAPQFRAATEHAMRDHDRRSHVTAAITLAGLLLAASVPATAQPVFADVAPVDDGYFDTPPESDFWASSIAPADIDGDGDQDLAVLGFFVVYNGSVEDRLVVLRNDGAGAGGRWNFTVVPVALGTLQAADSDLAWGDYDGDGDHDLAVGTAGVTRIYRNDAGALVDSGVALPGYAEASDYSGAYDLRSITWADFDNDGDLDLFLPTSDPTDPGVYHSALLRNDGAGAGGGWLFVDVNAAIDGAVHAQSAWIDDDDDGDLDLLLANSDPTFDSGSVRRFRNDDGQFVASALIAPAIQYGLADWADVDADGRTDILLAGNVLDADGEYRTVLRTYRALATGGFAAADLPAPAEPWLDLHAATWADYDSDGDVDLLATGSLVGDGEIIGRSRIYANDGSGALSPIAVALPAPQSSVGRGGAFTWFDLDGDGDLDYLVAGAYPVAGGNGLVEARIQLFRNGTAIANAAPTAPPAAQTAAQPGGVLLSWTDAADDHTAAAALTYEIELRRLGSPVTSVRRLPEPGRNGTANQWRIEGLAAGSYAWQVRAVDSAWHAGAAAGGSFTVVGGDALFASGFEP
jgi:hypothetical protein